MLATDQWGTLRDRLVAELRDLKSADEAADWVHKNLPAKNTPAAADAEAVEASFRAWLATMEGGQSAASSEQNNSGDEALRVQSAALDSREMPAPETAAVRRRGVAAKAIVCAIRSTANSSPCNRV